MFNKSQLVFFGEKYLSAALIPLLILHYATRKLGVTLPQWDQHTGSDLKHTFCALESEIFTL